MANTCVVFKDAFGQQIGIQILAPDGTVVATASSIVLALGDVSVDDKQRQAKFRLFQWKDMNSCQVQQAYFLMTEPESPT